MNGCKTAAVTSKTPACRLRVIAFVGSLAGLISLTPAVNAQTDNQLAKGKALVCTGFTPEACKEMLASPIPPKNPHDLVHRCQAEHAIYDYNKCDRPTNPGSVATLDAKLKQDAPCIGGYRSGWEMCADADFKLNGYASGEPPLNQKNSPIIYTTPGWEMCENANWPAAYEGDCYWEIEIHQKYLRIEHEYLEDYVRKGG